MGIHKEAGGEKNVARGLTVAKQNLSIDSDVNFLRKQNVHKTRKVRLHLCLGPEAPGLGGQGSISGLFTQEDRCRNLFPIYLWSYLQARGAVFPGTVFPKYVSTIFMRIIGGSREKDILGP